MMRTVVDHNKAYDDNKNCECDPNDGTKYISCLPLLLLIPLFLHLIG